MDAARAFSPGHVTGFFSIHPHENPLRHGSTGAGFSLSEGTTTVIRPAAEDEVKINGTPQEAPVSRSVLRLFRERTGTSSSWLVLHETTLPTHGELGNRDRLARTGRVLHREDGLDRRGHQKPPRRCFNPHPSFLTGAT